jgi:hypothetical protein
MLLDPLTPLRLSIGAARLGVRIGVEAAKLPLRILSELLGHEDGNAPTVVRPVPTPSRAEPEASATEPEPVPIVEAEERPYHPAFESEVEPEPEPEPPAHVDDEPELVAEFAEPGAGDGAGAELHIAEPWEGYRSLTAAQITARVSGASAAEVAVVQLYETSHRGRRSVLQAVERRSRQLANEPTPPH